MSRIWIFSIIFVMLAYALCRPTIINIPAVYPAIRQGIDAGVDGDTVLVQSGAYNENINFNGHNIARGSLFLTTGDTRFVSQTIIDGDSSKSVITFNQGENENATAIGFVKRNGCVSNGGGGIHCTYGSSPRAGTLTGTDGDSKAYTIHEIRLEKHTGGDLTLALGRSCNGSHRLRNETEISYAMPAGTWYELQSGGTWSGTVRASAGIANDQWRFFSSDTTMSNDGSMATSTKGSSKL